MVRAVQYQVVSKLEVETEEIPPLLVQVLILLQLVVEVVDIIKTHQVILVDLVAVLVEKLVTVMVMQRQDKEDVVELQMDVLVAAEVVQQMQVKMLQVLVVLDVVEMEYIPPLLEHK